LNFRRIFRSLGIRRVTIGAYRSEVKGLGAKVRGPKAESRTLLSPAVHPSLKNEDRSHTVDGLATFFNRQVSFSEEAIGLGGREALIPQMNRELKVFSQVIRKRLNLLGLHTFGARHAKRQANDDLLDLVIADDPVQEREVILLVPAVQSFQALRSNAQGVRHRDADAACANIEAEDATSGGFGSHARIIEGYRTLGFRALSRTLGISKTVSDTESLMKS
jgi:hypothetical protein